MLQGDFPEVLKCSKSCSLLQLCIIQTNDSAEVSLVIPSICGDQAKRQHNGQFANKLLLVFVAIWGKKVFGTSWDEEELYKTVCVSATHQRKALQGSKHLVDTPQFLIPRVFFLRES